MKIKSWIKANLNESLLIAILIASTVFLRFWRLSDYVVFLGDEGRDMLVMKQMIYDGKIPFLGPTASVGGFYLGPIYYWMAAPFLGLWRLDPAGPSYMVAILAALTVFLLYKFLREINYQTAFIASFLYAWAPLVVRYSRSSWNPNPLPFFSLVMVYFIYQGIKTSKLKFFLLSGLSFGIGIQLHYLAVLLSLVVGTIILINVRIKYFKILATLMIGSVLSFSPFLLFEIKHNFPNFHTILEFVTRGTTVGYRTSNLVWLVSNKGEILLGTLASSPNNLVIRFTFWFLILGGFLLLIKLWRQKSDKLIISTALIWFIVGLLGISLYRGQVFDYYFGFMFPAPFLLLGVVTGYYWSKFYIRILTLALAIISLFYFMNHQFYKSPPNRLIKQTESVADFVIDKSDNQPFNFGLISDHNSDHAYRYFLEIKGHPPTELETLVTEQLLVVCESKTCAPLGYPTWEIAGFGRGEIKGEWELPDIGIKVFKLTHWPGVPSPAGKPVKKGG